jgi:hypothetical protein
VVRASCRMKPQWPLRALVTSRIMTRDGNRHCFPIRRDQGVRSGNLNSTH